MWKCAFLSFQLSIIFCLCRLSIYFSSIQSVYTQSLNGVLTISNELEDKHYNLASSQTMLHVSRSITADGTCYNDSRPFHLSQKNIPSDTILSNCSCSTSTPIGTAAYTDWAFLVPCLFRFSSPYPPRTMYVQTAMLPVFAKQVLPRLPPGPPLILISGGMDLTIPRQIDQRYHPLDGFSGNRTLFHQILNSSRILRWYAENRDVSVGYEKFRTWPTGMSFAKKFHPDDLSDLHSVRLTLGYLSLLQKPLFVLVSDRLHGESKQMLYRREIRALCNRSPTCIVPKQEDNLEHLDFVARLTKVSFVACVHGGGIDPSPKAWEAILAGSIPIIQSSPLNDAYAQLPVVIVERWDQIFFSEVLIDELYPQYFEKLNSHVLDLTPSRETAQNATLLRQANEFHIQRLDQWRDQLAPYYEQQSIQRQAVLKRLQSAYWMKKLYDELDRHDQSHNVNTSFAAVRRAAFHRLPESTSTNSSSSSHPHTHPNDIPPDHSLNIPENIALFATLQKYPVFLSDGHSRSHNVTSTFARLKPVIDTSISHSESHPDTHSNTTSQENDAEHLLGKDLWLQEIIEAYYGRHSLTNPTCAEQVNTTTTNTTAACTPPMHSNNTTAPPSVSLDTIVKRFKRKFAGRLSTVQIMTLLETIQGYQQAHNASLGQEPDWNVLKQSLASIVNPLNGPLLTNNLPAKSVDTEKVEDTVSTGNPGGRKGKRHSHSPGHGGSGKNNNSKGGSVQRRLLRGG